jgi:N-acyl-D-amino-acid deacylase
MSYKVSQGVTTLVTGNGGIGIAPLNDVSPVSRHLLGGENQQRFEICAAYLQALRETPSAVRCRTASRST